MFRILILIVGLIFLNGCAKIAHLQELLTMKALSDNQDAQSKDVKKQDEKFKKLLEVVNNNQMSQYPNKKSFLKAFGEPIFFKEIEKDGQKLEQWLYRYSTKLFDSERMYIYFDREGKLVSWRHVKPEETKK